MKVTIRTVTTALPEYSRTTPEILPFLDTWLGDQDERFVRKIKKLFEGAGVDRRFSIMPPDTLFFETSFEKRNRIYKEGAIALGRQCLGEALEKAGWDATELDYIITVSCTGIMIPSLDAYLINELRLRQDIVRLPVTEMGCAAGVSGIIYAYDFLRSRPGKRAAVVAVESPTSTLQLNDFSMANMVSAAIFGDGAACVLLSSYDGDEGPEILDRDMYHFYDAERMMGFDLTDTGLKMVLDIEVPQVIAEHFERIVYPFLQKNGTGIEEVDHLIFHPGGKKIMQIVEGLFGVMGKNIDATKAVMRAFGNMSSATVLFVLEAFLRQEQQKGEQGLMLSFGPGFSAQQVLLQW